MDEDDVVAVGVAMLLVVEAGAIKLGDGHRGSVRGWGAPGSGPADCLHGDRQTRYLRLLGKKKADASMKRRPNTLPTS